MMVTTLNKIRAQGPCGIRPVPLTGELRGWLKLLKFLGKDTSDDEPLPFATILESNGLEDAAWCLRSVPEYRKQSNLFVIWLARYHQHLLTDQRGKEVLDLVEQFVDSELPLEQGELVLDKVIEAQLSGGLGGGYAGTLCYRVVYKAIQHVRGTADENTLCLALVTAADAALYSKSTPGSIEMVSAQASVEKFRTEATAKFLEIANAD